MNTQKSKSKLLGVKISNELYDVIKSVVNDMRKSPYHEDMTISDFVRTAILRYIADIYPFLSEKTKEKFDKYYWRKFY